MNEFFTAREIADALKLTRQAIHIRLQNVKPSGLKLVNNRHQTNAWTIPSLPAAMQAELEQKRIQGNFRTVEALLQNRCEVYAAALPLNQIADEQIADAIKLRTAFEEMLGRRNDMTLTSDEAGPYRRRWLPARIWARSFDQIYQRASRSHIEARWIKRRLFAAGIVSAR